MLATTRLTPWAGLAFIVIVGIVARLHAPVNITSDVNASMQEALWCVSSLCNPYAHYFTNTIPAGSPFPYLPGSMLYYWIQNGWWYGLAQMDRPASIIVVLALAAMGRIYGPGIAAMALSFYALGGMMLVRALDGSNDTAVAALVAIGVVALAFARSESPDRARWKLTLYIVSAIFFGWAIAFKALAWPVFAFMIRAVPQEYRKRWTVTAIAFAAVLSAPFFLWNPVAFVASILAGFTFHTNAWGFDIWSAIDHAWPGIVARWGQIPVFVEVVVVGFVGWALWTRRVTSIAGSLALASAFLAVTLTMIRWSTSSYYAFLAALVMLALASIDRTDEGMSELFSKG